MQRMQLPVGRSVIVFGAAIFIGACGMIWLYSAPSRVTTDNAYLKADTVQIAPKIHGLVGEVLVQDNQTVGAGDPLIRIDDTDYIQAVKAAQADLARAQAQIAAAHAALERNQAEAGLAEAGVREADARIQSADAESRRSARDRDRYGPLSKQGFASVQKFESATAGFETAGAEAKRVRAALDVAKAQYVVTHARADEIAAQLAEAEAAHAHAAAALALAQIDLDHTLVRAPVAGIIGDRHVEVGTFVQPGTRLMALVAPSTLYVLANFKETQTGQMKPGQVAHIEVDALPGQRFDGVVESLSPASGSEFALLPFEPGTGNFTKIVQRLPVRIRLNPDARNTLALRAGLSATVSVNLTN